MSGYLIDPDTGERVWIGDGPEPVEPEASRGPPLVIPGGWTVDFLAGVNSRIVPINPPPRPGHRPQRKSIRRFR